VEIAGEAMSLEALGFHAQIQQSQWINEFPGGIEGFIRRALETDAVIYSEIENFAELLAANLQHVNYGFLGMNLSVQPQWDFLWNPILVNEAIDTVLHTSWIAGFGLFLIPFLAAATQFLSMKINRNFTPQPAGPDGQQAKGMMMVMKFMPLMSIYIGFITPAALGFYWLLSSAFQTVTDVWLNKVYLKKVEAEEAVKNAERDKKEAELEAKRQETERLKAEGKITENKNTSKRKKQRGSRQEQNEKAAEWERKKKPEKRKPMRDEPGRVGDRRYARGRAYDPNRYKNAGSGVNTATDDDVSEDSKLATDPALENADIQNVDSELDFEEHGEYEGEHHEDGEEYEYYDDDDDDTDH
jgi:YidC/Oxa1 family membrane protein insertase